MELLSEQLQGKEKEPWKQNKKKNRKNKTKTKTIKKMQQQYLAEQLQG